MQRQKPRRRPRLTDREWEAIVYALGFVLAGEDPWHNDDEQEFSDIWKACQSAYKKL